MLEAGPGNSYFSNVFLGSLSLSLFGMNRLMWLWISMAIDLINESHFIYRTNLCIRRAIVSLRRCKKADTNYGSFSWTMKMSKLRSIQNSYCTLLLRTIEVELLFIDAHLIWRQITCGQLGKKKYIQTWLMLTRSAHFWMRRQSCKIIIICNFKWKRITS